MTQVSTRPSTVHTAQESDSSQLPDPLGIPPWPSQWRELGRPLDYLWTFELSVAPQRLWPLVADTSSFNKRLGLPPMRFEESGGRLLGRARVAGSELEWEEVPWEWEVGRGLSNARIYQRGFARVVRARFSFEPREGGGTRLVIYLGYVPRNWRGRLLIRMAMRQLRRGFDRVLREIETELTEGRASPPTPRGAPAPPSEPRFAEARRRLEERSLDPGLVESFLEHLRDAPEDHLDRIRVRPLARAWDRNWRDLLRVFLHATRLGYLRMTWDVICPHCRGVRQRPANLGDVPPRASCEACEIDFDPADLSSLEVTFQPHPSLRRVEPRVYCAAAPARQPHIRLQLGLDPGAVRAAQPHLPPGCYRLRIHGERSYHLLDVEGGEARRDLSWSPPAPPDVARVGPRPTVRIENAKGRPIRIVLEERAEDRDALRPGSLFAFQEFRDLFSEEAVAADMKLDIGVQTVLFTDLVGSTRYYEEEGDATAFARVRGHFVRIFDTVRETGGAVVKTIGDAAMAAFEEPDDAVAAAVRLQRFFSPSNPETDLRIRVTIHTGPCLAVRLNSAIDYFGSTVNLAAKLQEAAAENEIVMTEAPADDVMVQRRLAEEGLVPERFDFLRRWSGQTLPALRLRVT